MLLITPADPRSPDIRALLDEHIAEMRSVSPLESKHALDAEALCAPGVAFWAARREGELLGCAALLELDAAHGEVKSMRTARAHQRTGVGAALLEHLIAEARRRGYRRLSLETGSQDAFEPARALYARFGFTPGGPFGPYRPDPNSVFMTLAL